ncbi:MAG: hypothetical protein M1309_05785 [Actinobacteria bacterium]|nr:hypothetical protein [Actinomycetota bacterium]
MADEISSSGFKEKLTVGSLLLIAGAILSIVGSFMSWANLGFLSVSGSSGDGKITAIAGAVLLVTVIFIYSSKKRNTRVTSVVGFIVGLLLFFLAAYDGTNISNSGSSIIPASVGTGIYVVALGGILSTLGSISVITNLNKDNFFKLGELSKRNKMTAGLMLLLAIGVILLGYFSANG